MAFGKSLDLLKGGEMLGIIMLSYASVAHVPIKKYNKKKYITQWLAYEPGGREFESLRAHQFL